MCRRMLIHCSVPCNPELQEYRHATTSHPPSAQPLEPSSLPPTSPSLAPVEIVLISLNGLLESTSELLPSLRVQLSALSYPPQSRKGQGVLDDQDVGIGTMDLELIQVRYEEIYQDFQDAVADVEQAREELKEDRWLSVFR